MCPSSYSNKSNYSKDFYIFSFASEDTMASVLLQKNDQGQEQPLAYMSKILRDSELKYHIVEKQVYDFVNSLKHFKNFIGYTKVIGYVPSSAIKDVLTQEEGLGPRGRWVAKIQKYDLEIKPTKLIKGQGLAKC